MSTLIKPPCCNEGQITAEQNLADAYLSDLYASTKYYTVEPFKILINSYECSFSRMGRSFGKPALQDNRTDRLYTIDEIYYIWKAINHDKDLTPDEWNEFIYEFVNLAESDKYKFAALLKCSLEQGIKNFVYWDRAKVKEEMDVLVTTYADVNTLYYNNDSLNTKAQNSILRRISNKPFKNKEAIIADVCKKYNFYTPWDGHDEREFVPGTMK